MGDGSHLGVDADRALKTILGGEPAPSPDEMATPIEVRSRVCRAYLDRIKPEGGVPSTEWPGYGDAADIAAGAVYIFMLCNPEAMEWPTDRKYEGEGYDRHPVGPDLYGEVKAFCPEAALNVIENLSGFQWGWAVNTARYCFGLDERGNPAIISIGVSDE